MQLRQIASLGALLILGTATAPVHAVPQQGTSAGAVTFNKQVLPILQKNCQACHRPGEIAPMPFLTYQDARPWAKAIKVAVMKRQMPPWFADPAHGPQRSGFESGTTGRDDAFVIRPPVVSHSAH